MKIWKIFTPKGGNEIQGLLRNKDRDRLESLVYPQSECPKTPVSSWNYGPVVSESTKTSTLPSKQSHQEENLGKYGLQR